MVIKVFVSNTSGNMEMKTKQDFIQQLLVVKQIKFEEVDISDPKLGEQKLWMRNHAQAKKGQHNALPPQVFHDDEYCGDYDELHDANERDLLHEFLKLEASTPEKKDEEDAGEIEN